MTRNRSKMLQTNLQRQTDEVQTRGFDCTSPGQTIADDYFQQSILSCQGVSCLNSLLASYALFIMPSLPCVLYYLHNLNLLCLSCYRLISGLHSEWSGWSARLFLLTMRSVLWSLLMLLRMYYCLHLRMSQTIWAGLESTLRYQDCAKRGLLQLLNALNSIFFNLVLPFFQFYYKYSSSPRWVGSAEDDVYLDQFLSLSSVCSSCFCLRLLQLCLLVILLLMCSFNWSSACSLFLLLLSSNSATWFC